MTQIPHPQCIARNARAAIVAAAILFMMLPLISSAQGQGQPEDTPEARAQAVENQKAIDAQGPSSNVGGGDKTSCSIFSDGFGCAFYWILDAVTDLLIWLTMNPIAALFDSAVALALQPPSGLQFVQLGFRITLGVANIFFIFILLWIAIATIFDYSPYSAKAILPTLIFAALLVNFSLAIGNGVVQLANGIGMLFYQQVREIDLSKQNIVGLLPSSPIAQKVMALSKFQTMTDTRPSRQAITLSDVRTEAERECNSLRSTVTLGVSCIYAWFDGLWRWWWEAPKRDEAFLEKALQAVLFKLITLPILLFVLLIGAVLLIVRTISLAFLLILAPLAFLFMVLPYTRSYTGMWWQKLIQWSVFLPAFLFFIFLSLEAGSSFTQNFIAAAGNENQQLPAFIQYLMISGLLIGSLIAAQKSSLVGSNTMVGWGKKIYGAAGGWMKGSGKIAGGLAARTALQGLAAGQQYQGGRIVGAIPGLARTIRGVAGVAQRVAGRPLEAATVAGDKISEARRKASISRQAAATRIIGGAGMDARIRSLANDEARINFLKELGQQDKNLFKDAINTVGTDLLRSIRAEARRLSEDEFGDQLIGAIRDLTTAIEVETGVDRTAQDFQNRFNSWFASAEAKQINRVVKDGDIYGPNANPYLNTMIETTADLDVLKALANTREKAGALREKFIDLGNRTGYNVDIAGGASEFEAARNAIRRAIAAGSRLNASNPQLAFDINGTPAVQVNLARGVPLSRKKTG